MFVTQLILEKFECYLGIYNVVAHMQLIIIPVCNFISNSETKQRGCNKNPFLPGYILPKTYLLTLPLYNTKLLLKKLCHYRRVLWGYRMNMSGVKQAQSIPNS